MNPRPGPENLMEFLAWLGDCVEEILRGRDEERVNASAAARALGFKPSFFHAKPWRIPGFGLQGTMHALSTWKAWLDRPEVDRRAEWELMPLDQRRKARGIAA